MLGDSFNNIDRSIYRAASDVLVRFYGDGIDAALQSVNQLPLFGGEVGEELLIWIVLLRGYKVLHKFVRALFALFGTDQFLGPLNTCFYLHV